MGRLRASLILTLATVVLTFPSVDPSAVVRHDVMIPSPSMAHTGATQDSVNWSGYAALPARGHRMTGVPSTFEAPTVGGQTVLPSMSTTTFDPDNSASLDGGPKEVIASRRHIRLTMNSVEGIPSSLDKDGDGFDACAYTTSCSAPSS